MLSCIPDVGRIIPDKSKIHKKKTRQYRPLFRESVKSWTYALRGGEGRSVFNLRQISNRQKARKMGLLWLSASDLYMKIALSQAKVL